MEEPGRPSIFELVAQQGFATALRPAFFHCVKVLAERYPEGRIPLLFRKFDELYLFFDVVVQGYYIKTRRATLAEAFYGLERGIVVKDNRTPQFKNAILKGSYLISIMVPYAKVQLDKLHQKLLDQQQTSHSITTESSNSRNISKLTSMFQQLYVKYYPLLNGFVELMNLLCLLRFSFGHSKTHNLLFLLMGVHLQYALPSRARLLEEKRSELFSLNSWSLRKAPILLLRGLGESILFGVEIGSFFAQFLDWWYNDDRKEQILQTSLPVPPPLSEKDDNFVRISEKEKNLCPICRQKFRNPTAISTSGIVYCYGCILPFIKQHGQCAVTSLKCDISHLIRIFA